MENGIAIWLPGGHSVISTFFHWQKPDLAGLQEFLKPLNEVILKASALTEGRRSEFFNHLKTVADSLTALAWVAYSGKDCGQYSTNFYSYFLVSLWLHCREILTFISCIFPGMNMPTSHVEESWQMAEFYNNKVCQV